MKNRNSALCIAALLLVSVSAQSDDCEFERELDTELDLSSADSLAIVARAGTLEITGKQGSGKAQINARICASKQDWLEASGVALTSGRNASIEVELPDTGNGWSWTGQQYAYVDLVIVVPDDIALDVTDSSGSLDIDGVGALTLKDSSGSIEIENTHGPLILRDSSGSIGLRNIKGDVTIVSDSSGSISGKHIEGSVVVEKDSSGSIRFSDVSGDFTVEKDSSGGISADDIGGDFTVLKDGSGGIHSSNVRGEVRIPSDD